MLLDALGVELVVCVVVAVLFKPPTAMPDVVTSAKRGAL